MSLEYNRLVDPTKFVSGCAFNIHFSLLPAYKGCLTSIWPILRGEARTGVTLHLIDSGIDSGDVIDQCEIEIKENWTSRDLYFEYNRVGFELFKRWISKLICGDYTAHPQRAEGASYYSRKSIDFGNLEINLNQTAWEVRNYVRAMHFPEYQRPSFQGRAVSRADICYSKTRTRPGRTIEIDQSGRYVVAGTIDFPVRLTFV